MDKKPIKIIENKIYYIKNIRLEWPHENITGDASVITGNLSDINVDVSDDQWQL